MSLVRFRALTVGIRKPTVSMLVLRFHPGARTRGRGLHTSAFARHLGLTLGTALFSRLVFGGSVTLELAAGRKVTRRIAHCCRLVAHLRKEVAFRFEYQITSRARARVGSFSSRVRCLPPKRYFNSRDSPSLTLLHDVLRMSTDNPKISAGHLAIRT